MLQEKVTSVPSVIGIYPPEKGMNTTYSISMKVFTRIRPARIVLLYVIGYKITAADGVSIM